MFYQCLAQTRNLGLLKGGGWVGTMPPPKHNFPIYKNNGAVYITTFMTLFDPPPKKNSSNYAQDLARMKNTICTSMLLHFCNLIFIIPVLKKWHYFSSKQRAKKLLHVETQLANDYYTS